MTHTTVLNPSTKTSTCHPTLVTARVSAMQGMKSLARSLPFSSPARLLDAASVLRQRRQDRSPHDEEQHDQGNQDCEKRHDHLNADFTHGAQRTGRTA